jgi:hypothetical protein
MNKTTAEIMDMQSKGLIPADRAIKILVEGMNKRFPDMMKNMENTWEGVTSTIKDVWRMTIGAVTQNLFQGVVSWLQKVRDFAVGFYDTFQRYGLQRAISESFGPEVAAMVSVLGAALRGLASVVSAVTGFITQYGKQIRFVAVVMGTYLVLLKTVTLAKWLATVATTALTNSQLLLAGQSSATTGIIGFLSNVITFYKVQMLTASATTNVFTGALVRLQAALYAVWTALGPIGLAIIALSVAVGVGMNIWNKYKSALEQAKMQSSLAAIEEQTKKLGQSSEDAAAGTDDLTEATQKAGEAAGKNLQSFDEVHQLQEDMAGSAEDLAKSMGLDVPEVEGLEDLFDAAAPDLSGIQVSWKEILSAIWNDVKEGAGNLWEKVKEKWNGFWNWVKGWGIWTTLKEKWDGLKEGAGNLWEKAKEKWNGFTSWVSSWGIWTTLKEKWNGLKEGAGNLWEKVKEKWNGFKEWAANMWDGAKEKWGNFTGWVQEKWSSFKTKAGEIWTGIKTNVQTKWEELKTNAPVIWENIKTSIQTRWENLKTNAGETWNNIKTGIEEKWNSLKTNAPTVWENIKTSIQTRWDNLVSGASEKWGNIKTTISEKWEELKTNAPTTWENIKKEISDRWENLKTNAPTTWENIKTSIQDRWEALKTNAPTAWENIRKSIDDKWEELKTNAPITWENIKKEISNRWEDLKEDAPKTWGEIAEKLADIWDGIKISASEKWDGVKTVIKGAINGIIGFINKFIEAWNKIELKVPEVNIPLVGTVGGWTVRVPQIDPITPLAKGGLVTAPTLAMLGETGPEAVIPLGRSGFAGDLADTVAQAVYRAIIDAIRIAQASGQSGDNKELVLKIDNTVLARMQLPAIIREGQRQGLNLVVQPQGV